MARGSWARIGAILGVAALVPACGGGGGGGGGAVASAIGFLSAVFAASEGDGTVTITVRRTGSSGAASVNYATSNGTATAGADYTAAAGTLSWADGESGNKTFTVDVANADTLVEGTETVLLQLSLSQGAPLGVLDEAVVLLRDLDGPAEGVFQFSAATYTVSEGAATVQATVTVERNGGAAGAATVDVAIADGSADSSDYAPTSPLTSTVTLSFADGETSKSFTIDVFSDASVDSAGEETVALTLQNATPAPGPEIGSTLGSAVLNIVDRDVPGSLQLSASNYDVFENGVSVTVTVTRSGGSGAVSADLDVADDTATAGADYVAPATNPVPLAWAAGDLTPRTLVLVLVDDPDLEGTESVDLTLQNPGGGVTLGSAGTVTILDDEPGTVEFLAADFSVTEGNAGTTTVTITVVRSGGSSGAASVEVTVADGTATEASDDYEFPAPNPAVLAWANGESGPKTFDITVNGDATVELDETIALSLGGESGVGLGVLTSATATITNDDVSTAGTIEFLSAAVTVVESDGSVVLTVRRVGGTNGALSVDFATANGTARSNGKPSWRDYEAEIGTLNWADGDGADKTITVTILNNDTLGDSQDTGADETFTVTLTPVGAEVISGTNPATVTIQDD